MNDGYEMNYVACERGSTKKILLLFLLSVTFLLCGMMSCKVQANAKLVKTAESLCKPKNIIIAMSGPGSKYEPVGTFCKEDKLLRVGKDGSWSLVEANGMSYYVKTSELKIISTYRYVSSKDGLSIRKGPGVKYKKLYEAPYNSKLVTKGKAKSGWIKVKYKGKILYASRKYMVNSKIKEPESEEKENSVAVNSNATKSQVSVSATSKGIDAVCDAGVDPFEGITIDNDEKILRLKIIATAKLRLGDKYSQSKRNEPGYADCSSLARDTFLSVMGVNIGVNTDAQIKTLKKYRKGIKTMLPGDIMMHVEPGSNHCAIYIGNGEYIHASSSKGKVLIATYYPKGSYTWRCYDALAYCKDHR